MFSFFSVMMGKILLLFFVLFFVFSMGNFLVGGRFYFFLLFWFSFVVTVCSQMGSKRFLGFSHLLVSLFLFIGVLNLGGFFPLFKAISTHPGFVVSVVLPIWMMIPVFSLWVSPSGFLSNFVPSGTPIAISFFVSLVELLSVLCRPLSLTLRVMVNMTVGHILLSWHWQEISVSFMSFFMLAGMPTIGWSMSVFLTLFHIWWEMAVCVFQALVMVGLLSIYCEDFPKVSVKKRW